MPKSKLMIPYLDIPVSKVAKIAGLLVLASIVLAVMIRLVGSSAEIAFKSVSSDMAMAPGPAMGLSYGGEVEEMALSSRNIAPMDDGQATGSDAEDYEVKQYNATVETRNLEDDCAVISGLKAKDYVIFERSNEFEKSCNYTFKVANDNIDEILAVVESLDPRELNEIRYSIKRQIEDFTSEEEILKAKLASIDETITNALESYDKIAALATRTQDAESLAKIIDSKLKIIERLTSERIETNARLERLERAKAQQLDRLEYTYFNVYIYENKFIDGQVIKDSWKASIRQFVRDINQIGQDISLNLVSLIIRIFQYALYALILLIVVKYGWRIGKKIWQK
jgi:hypothetical protein